MAPAPGPCRRATESVFSGWDSVSPTPRIKILEDSDWGAGVTKHGTRERPLPRLPRARSGHVTTRSDGQASAISSLSRGLDRAATH